MAHQDIPARLIAVLVLLLLIVARPAPVLAQGGCYSGSFAWDWNTAVDVVDGYYTVEVMVTERAGGATVAVNFVGGGSLSITPTENGVWQTYGPFEITEVWGYRIGWAYNICPVAVSTPTPTPMPTPADYCNPPWMVLGASPVAVEGDVAGVVEVRTSIPEGVPVVARYRGVTVPVPGLVPVVVGNIAAGAVEYLYIDEPISWPTGSIEYRVRMALCSLSASPIGPSSWGSGALPVSPVVVPVQIGLQYIGTQCYVVVPSLSLEWPSVGPVSGGSFGFPGAQVCFKTYTFSLGYGGNSLTAIMMGFLGAALAWIVFLIARRG